MNFKLLQHLSNSNIFQQYHNYNANHPIHRNFLAFLYISPNWNGKCITKINNVPTLIVASCQQAKPYNMQSLYHLVNYMHKQQWPPYHGKVENKIREDFLLLPFSMFNQNKFDKMNNVAKVSEFGYLGRKLENEYVILEMTLFRNMWQECFFKRNI